MPAIGKLRQIQQGSIRILGVSSGTLRPARVQTAIINYDTPAYEGEYTVTPSQETQILQTEDLRMTANVTINPIPSNYGLITWNGSFLTVS